MTTLDAFITRARALPVPVATSQEIRDRGSTFVATIFRCSTPEHARVCIQHTANVLHGSKPASHEIAAWRCMVLKQNHSGLGGPNDFEVKNGYDDNGEQWAGDRVLKVLKAEAVIDAVLIVSRWYGGNMLGPIRFTHIETCAAEVCQAFKQHEELDESVLALSTLDQELEDLRTQLNALNEGPGGGKPVKQPNYPTWTTGELPKAKRLVNARENAIKAMKELIAEKKAATC